MRLKIEIFFSFVVFTILIYSCKKNSLSAPPDPGGTILDKEVYLDSSSGSISTLQYLYNSSGDLITIGSASPNGGDSLTYSAPGKLSRYKAGNAWEAIMVYDSAGRIAGTKGSAMQNFFGRVFTYDSKNRVIADTSYADSAKVNFYKSYSYDNNDNMISYQEFTVLVDGTVLTNGSVIVTYDHHPNPHAKFGKWIYYADGDFRFLFRENSVSEKIGSFEEKVPPDMVYKYYSDGQLWQASSHLYGSLITYYYK